MVEIRAIRDDEIAAYRQSALMTFGLDSEEDPTGESRQRATIPDGRAWAAFDRGDIVATAGAFPLAMVMPGGGVLQTAGLTMVTVRPTHRRRGLLRELIRVHLDDMRARGEAASALWASEATIYGRFGYGIAAESLALEVDVRGLAIGGGGADVVCRFASREEALAVPLEVYVAATAERPGAMRRDAVWWRERAFLEGAWFSEGASRRRYVIAWRGERAVGYVSFRQRDVGHAGRAEVIELVGIDADADCALWRFMASLDLFPTVAWKNAPVDTVLPWIASDPRKVTRKPIDTLWVRVDDVARVLEARRYAADGAVRIGVDGATWELAVERGVATCRRSEAAAEVVVDRAGLGSMLLGHVTATQLVRAGRASGRADRADRLFAWQIAPWCVEQF